ncbi:MAG: threonine--tRNA ligase [Nitrospira sp.]|uniref:threonine--tRNA ligase n=1 Tax=Nitrospira sp. ND1 TaxID=1658518 RepID=UPI0009BB2D37|nr:threonine--tRNA ligase [Nitrospira sp. ND1]MBK7418639.1 threonine--tRNA ligase [Nitrospira sp.]MBK7486926.1 threonine--tRNA ligase [Nitrospira sp.]MBK9998669.1 threonine--tRNA ligase [Nitrospira sp.]MBP6201134.1 threonine--tRNA ligase [Nitrospira sp.]MBP6207346.1 threonine--tRNA ligase [Nitrospira sp.]
MASQFIHITLPDGTRKQVPAGCTVREALTPEGGRLDAKVLAAKINGEPRDLSCPLEQDATIEPLTFESAEGREVYRHSSTHIMAQAVKEVFPTAQLTIGPALDDGFYYDFAFDRPFTPEDLEKIEARAIEIMKRGLTVTRSELSKQDAIKFFQERGEGYKVELINSFDDASPISLYRQGEFVDLCRGPHLPTTGYVGAFKLLSTGGAYWRGDERNPMLQRVYGTSFPTKKELDAHLAKLEEIKRRDHRKLGKELDLITIQDEIGPGLVLWHPKGSLIRLLIENFWREQHIKDGYDLVYSPHVARLDLWKTSGHVDYYRENMFVSMKLEGSEYQLKPMNCPFHIMIYKSHMRSYRDLPIRYGELGTVYRYERTGVLHGLLRVRGFTQDDAHLFCRPDQIEAEVSRVLDFTFFVLGTFGFTEFEVYLSTRPEKSVGSEENWTIATNALEAALKSRGVAYEVDPGEGVFYGPKIDIKIKDVLGRSWQCSTVQVDFNNPERFKLAYTGEDGKAHQPIMIHRALMGSIERFFGILIEHYAGAFPTWLAPVQAVVLTITDNQQEFAAKIVSTLKSHGFRVEADIRNEKIGFKIREAEKNKIPYMLVVGDKEVQSGMVSVRGRSGANHGSLPIEAFLELLRTDANQTLRQTATHSQTR